MNDAGRRWRMPHATAMIPVAYGNSHVGRVWTISEFITIFVVVVVHLILIPHSVVVFFSFNGILKPKIPFSHCLLHIVCCFFGWCRFIRWWWAIGLVGEKTPFPLCLRNEAISWVIETFANGTVCMHAAETKRIYRFIQYFLRLGLSLTLPLFVIGLVCAANSVGVPSTYTRPTEDASDACIFVYVSSGWAACRVCMCLCLRCVSVYVYYINFL